MLKSQPRKTVETNRAIISSYFVLPTREYITQPCGVMIIGRPHYQILSATLYTWRVCVSMCVFVWRCIHTARNAFRNRIEVWYARCQQRKLKQTNAFRTWVYVMRRATPGTIIDRTKYVPNSHPVENKSIRAWTFKIKNSSSTTATTTTTTYWFTKTKTKTKQHRYYYTTQTTDNTTSTTTTTTTSTDITSYDYARSTMLTKWFNPNCVKSKNKNKPQSRPVVQGQAKLSHWKT